MPVNAKIAILGGATTILAGVFGYAFGLLLSGGSLLWLVVSGTVFGAAYLVETMSVGSKKLLAGLCFAHAIAFAVFVFASPAFAWYGIVLLSGAFLAVAGWRGRRAMDGSLSPNLGRVAALALPMAASALALMMAFVYVSGFVGRDFTIPKESVAGLLRPAESPLRGFVSGFTFDMSVREFARVSLESRAPAEIRALPREVKDQLVRESEAQFVNALSGFLKVPVSPQESILTILHKALSAQLIKIPADLQTPILLGFGFLVFLAIKGLALLLRYPTAWLAMGLYKLLLAIGFLRVMEEEVKRQIVVL
jgi:hypothetical protein